MGCNFNINAYYIYLVRPFVFTYSCGTRMGAILVWWESTLSQSTQHSTHSAVPAGPGFETR